MNISMYTSYARNTYFKSDVEGFRHFREKGVRFGDILSNELATVELAEYCKRLKEGGLIPGAFVSLADTASFDAAKREKNLAAVRKWIDGLAELNVPKIMLAPAVAQARTKDDFLRMRELLIEGFADAVEYAKGSGITVMIENQSLHVRADSHLSDLKYILDAVPGLGFVLDTGNFFCIGESVLDAYEALKEKIVHVHVKDWAFDLWGQFVRENMPRFEGVAIGDGVLPNAEILKRLKDGGYEGNVVLEVNSGKMNLEMLDRSADFLRAHV